jgi:ADP-ribose pyrophosphatase YjhB (NUDIX family)
MDKSLDQTVSRIFLEKANVSEFYLEQLGTFGALDRDPRGRVISIAYFALVPAETLQTAIHENRLSQLARLDVPWDGETGGEIRAMSQDDAVLPLAFDHAAILGQVVKRLRGKLYIAGGPGNSRSHTGQIADQTCFSPQDFGSRIDTRDRPTRDGIRISSSRILRTSLNKEGSRKWYRSKIMRLCENCGPTRRATSSNSGRDGKSVQDADLHSGLCRTALR